MAGKTYVVIAPVAVKVFDNKYKSTLAKRVTDALGDAIDGSSKLTTKAPKEKDAEGLYVAPAITLTRTDKGVEADLKCVLADWPKKNMFASKASNAGTEVPNPAKIDQHVNDIIAAALTNLPKNVVDALEKKAR